MEFDTILLTPNCRDGGTGEFGDPRGSPIFGELAAISKSIR